MDSPAEIVKIDGNLDVKMTSPTLMAAHFVDPLRGFADRLHGAGKLVACHADGEMTGLLRLVCACGIDVAEAFTPPPMTRCTVGQARAAWGDKVSIWGGIASVAMCPDTMSAPAFDAYVANVLNEAEASTRFVLGLGDNLPTDGSFERLLRVGAMVDAYRV